MTYLFSTEKINSGRQKELDFAKGLAIIFMIIVHVNEVYQNSNLEGGIYNRFIEFIGSPPAAPIFMFLLGVGIVYSKNNSANILFKRGIYLFSLGYILNFFRDFIPYMLLSIKYADPSYKVEAIDSLFGIDILPFAGLTFLFFALMKKLNLKDKFLPLIWCLLAATNILIRDISFHNDFANSILGLIWGTDDYSWFPFLSWIAYPILGYLFANLLIRCKNKKVFYKNCLVSSLALLIPLLIYAYINDVHFGAFGEMYQETYYHHDFMGNIILGTFSIFWISLLSFIVDYLPEYLNVVFIRFSKNSSKMYCIHWILLGYSMLFLNIESYGPIVILLISAIFTLLTDILCILITKHKTKGISVPFSN